eukprot:10401377-Lingulodinium_polyedra.AAC.1
MDRVPGVLSPLSPRGERQRPSPQSRCEGGWAEAGALLPVLPRRERRPYCAATVSPAGSGTVFRQAA